MRILCWVAAGLVAVLAVSGCGGRDRPTATWEPVLVTSGGRVLSMPAGACTQDSFTAAAALAAHRYTGAESPSRSPCTW